MKAPPAPPDDAQRLAALHDLLILDTEPEDRFDVFTVYCASRFGVEISLVSLVDKDRQWVKSSFGLATRQTSRDVSFCAHAILDDGPMIVEDALADERFRDHPLVLGAPHIRFYGGFPLRLSCGHPVGALCLIDSRPRHLDPDEVIHLQDIARLVVKELEQRPAHQPPLLDAAPLPRVPGEGQRGGTEP